MDQGSNNILFRDPIVRAEFSRSICWATSYVECCSANRVCSNGSTGNFPWWTDKFHSKLFSRLELVWLPSRSKQHKNMVALGVAVVHGKRYLLHGSLGGSHCDSIVNKMLNRNSTRLDEKKVGTDTETYNKCVAMGTFWVSTWWCTFLWNPSYSISSLPSKMYQWRGLRRNDRNPHGAGSFIYRPPALFVYEIITAFVSNYLFTNNP